MTRDEIIERLVSEWRARADDASTSDSCVNVYLECATKLAALPSAPAERAVLDACAEMLLVPSGGRVRAPNERDVELVAEAEWARRQEHRVSADDMRRKGT